MKCPKCGQICRNNRKFCALCGTPLKQKQGHGWLIAVIVILALILVGLIAWQFFLKDLPLFQGEGQPAELVTYDEPEPGEGETPKAAPEPLATENTGETQLLFEDAAEVYALPTYTLALCRDGSVKLAGQSASPEFGFDLFDWQNIRQVVATDYFVAGLTEDGRVRLTGEVGGYEEAARWTDVTALVFDAGNLLGLTADGRVLAAGPSLSFDPSGLKDIVSIIPGQVDSLAVRSDGRVKLLKVLGMLWDAEGLTGLQDVAVGSDYAMYLTEDGAVHTGASLYRILDSYGWANPYYEWKDIRQLVVMNHVVLGLTREGQVLAETHIPGESKPDTSSWTGVVRIVTDDSRNCVFGLTEDGRVLIPPEDAEVLKEVSAWENVRDLQINERWIAALTGDGRVLTWSWDPEVPAPDTSEWSKVSAISLGQQHLAALREDGGVLAAGDNSFGQCGPNP